MPSSAAIIDEIHAIRDAIARAADNDLQKIAEAARARQLAAGRPAVKLPPRRPATTKKAS